MMTQFAFRGSAIGGPPDEKITQLKGDCGQVAAVNEEIRLLDAVQRGEFGRNVLNIRKVNLLVGSALPGHPDGLGLEAQSEAISRFAEAERLKIADTFAEVETLEPPTPGFGDL